jgi:hypothetical protein
MPNNHPHSTSFVTRGVKVAKPDMTYKTVKRRTKAYGIVWGSCGIIGKG